MFATAITVVVLTGLTLSIAWVVYVCYAWLTDHPKASRPSVLNEVWIRDGDPRRSMRH